MSCEPLLQTLFVKADITPQRVRGVGAPAYKYLDISVSDFPDQGEFGKCMTSRLGTGKLFNLFYSVGSVAHPDKFQGKA